MDHTTRNVKFGMRDSADECERGLHRVCFVCCAASSSAATRAKMSSVSIAFVV
jgi:hypothetical protein